MKYIFRISVLLIMTLSIFSCSSEKDNFSELDLLDKGFPIKLMAPDSAVVKVNNMAFMKDVTIIDDSGYNVQILISKITKSSEVEIIAKIKQQVQENPYFSEMQTENPHGFIYKNMIDSIPSYDFRYVKLKGGKEYVFQTGLSANFGLSEVQNMYESVSYQDK